MQLPLPQCADCGQISPVMQIFRPGVFLDTVKYFPTGCKTVRPQLLRHEATALIRSEDSVGIYRKWSVEPVREVGCEVTEMRKQMPFRGNNAVIIPMERLMKCNMSSVGKKTTTKKQWSKWNRIELSWKRRCSGSEKYFFIYFYRKQKVHPFVFRTKVWN